MATISKATASKSYNQKTIAAIKARDAAKAITTTKISSGSSSSKATTTPTSSSQSSQLDAIKQTLLKMQSDLKAGNVTGLTPSAPAAPTTPTTPNLPASPITSGLTPQQQINEANAQAIRFGLKVNDAIPSTAVTSMTTPQDVMDKRALLEKLQGQQKLQGQLKTKQQEFADLLKASQTDPMESKDGLNTMNPITNPDKYLSQYFTTDASRNLTPAQIEQKRLLDESAKATEDFYKNRDNNVADAYDQYGVTAKQKALSNIQKEMAQREVKLRNDIQVLETAPEYRGVSREFANDQREQIKSKGAFDLANLAIVESAYNGDLTQARSLAQDLIDNQFSTFEGKIEGYKARLAALMPTLDAEEKKQALALETAFNAQAQALAEKKADTELKYEYMTLAAKAGAPESVYKAILKSTSADEAFLLAAPYLKGSDESTTTNGGGASNVGGITQVVPNLSPFNGSLANIDFTASKMSDIKKAVNEQFAPAFSTKLISILKDEDLRQFLTMYDAEMRKQGMNIDPEMFLKFFLETYLGQTTGGADTTTVDNPFR